MTEAAVVMENFMQRLGSNGFKKENQPNMGPHIDADFIRAQLASYSELLKSKLIDEALNE